MKVPIRHQRPDDAGGKGAEERPVPGDYHSFINWLDDSHTEYPKNIVVRLEILAGSVSGQEGTMMREFFYYDPDNVKPRAVDRIIRFAWACGLIGEDEEKDLNIRFAIGRQLVVKLVERTYTDKKSGEEKMTVRIDPNGGMWPTDHSDVRDVPKDQEAVALSSPIVDGSDHDVFAQL